MTLLDGFGKATEEVVALRAEVVLLRVVVEAARAAQNIARAYDRHTVRCQDSPCDVCDDLAEREQDAYYDLDVALANLSKTKPSCDHHGSVTHPRNPDGPPYCTRCHESATASVWTALRMAQDERRLR